MLHNLVHGTNALAMNSVIPTEMFKWINHKHSYCTHDFNSLELLNSGQTDMALKYSNFRFCFTRGTDSKTSYTVFSHVNCETGNITYQVGTDGDKQLHCTQLFTDSHFSVDFTPNHSLKLLISFLLGPLLEKCFNFIAIPMMRNQDVSISTCGHGV